jgi:cytidine deaminase
MIKKEIKTIITEYDSISELEDIYALLIRRSREASKNSYAPFSSFHVGAAVLLENNEIITGSNQENIAFPSGICAERVAIFYANSMYPDLPVKAIAIYAYSDKVNIEIPVSPCGSCRQVLSETESRFNTPIKVILSGNNKIYMIEGISGLLPIAFNKNLFDN